MFLGSCSLGLSYQHHPMQVGRVPSYQHHPMQVGRVPPPWWTMREKILGKLNGVLLKDRVRV